MKAAWYRPSDEAAQDLESSESALRLTILYEDLLTRQWAGQINRLVGQFIDTNCLSSDSWRVGDLAAPEVLKEAACAAAQADVIVLCLHDADELPLNLRVWIEAWLPRRDLPVGALIALIGVAENPRRPSLRMREYLEELARQARMDLLFEERRFQSPSPQIADLRQGCVPASSILPKPDNPSRRERGANNPVVELGEDDSTKPITRIRRFIL